MVLVVRFDALFRVSLRNFVWVNTKWVRPQKPSNHIVVNACGVLSHHTTVVETPFEDLVLQEPERDMMGDVYQIRRFGPGLCYSLREENRRVRAILMLLHALLLKWPFIINTHDRIDLSFDWRTVVDRINKPPKTRKEFLCLDYDVWALLVRLRRLIPFDDSFRWVQGHQTEDIDLPPRAKVNIVVDKEAAFVSHKMEDSIPTQLEGALPSQCE